MLHSDPLAQASCLAACTRSVRSYQLAGTRPGTKTKKGAHGPPLPAAKSNIGKRISIALSKSKTVLASLYLYCANSVTMFVSHCVLLLCRWSVRCVFWMERLPCLMLWLELSHNQKQCGVRYAALHQVFTRSCIHIKRWSDLLVASTKVL